MKCSVRTAIYATGSLCPVDRCEVQGLYQLQGDQVRIHESMCGAEDNNCVETQNEMEIVC